MSVVNYVFIISVSCELLIYWESVSVEVWSNFYDSRNIVVSFDT